jgi:hypothetical protein
VFGIRVRHGRLPAAEKRSLKFTAACSALPLLVPCTAMEEEVKEAYDVKMCWMLLLVCGFISQKSFAKAEKDMNHRHDRERTEIWVTAENANNERVSRVENQIVVRSRDRLGTARNANEMFRVFSKFNGLFVRPKVCFVNWAANFLLITKTDPCFHPRISNGTH